MRVAMRDQRAAARKMLIEREARRERELEELLRAARADFERTVALIVKEYDPQEIWQWGSLLYPETFSRGSDIDVGILGVSVRDHMKVLRLTEGTTCLPLHIARLEEMDPRYVEHLRKYGRRVYPDGCSH
jgi:hypothetical protein